MYVLIIVAWVGGSIDINTNLRFEGADAKQLCDDAKKITTQPSESFGVPRMVSDCILIKKDSNS